MNRKSTVLLIIVATFIIGLSFVILYNIRNTNNINRAGVYDSRNIEEFDENIVDENLIGNYIVTTSTDEAKVSPNAQITFYKKYEDCNHIIKEKSTIENSIVNLTEEDIRKVYKDWEIMYFSNDCIELYQEVPGQCGEHFLVKEEEGIISVFKVANDDSLIKMQDTDIEIEYLPIADREDLKDGVEIIGKEELNSYLENFE